MKRKAFLIAFLTMIPGLAIMVVAISRNQAGRFLESDIVRNGQQDIKYICSDEKPTRFMISKTR